MSPKLPNRFRRDLMLTVMVSTGRGGVYANNLCTSTYFADARTAFHILDGLSSYFFEFVRCERRFTKVRVVINDDAHYL